MAIGRSCTTSVRRSIAIGYEGSILQDSSVAIGYQTSISADGEAGGRSVAIGYATDIDSSNSVAIGAYSVGHGDYSVSIGYKSNITGDFALVIGDSAYVSTDSSIAIGYQANVSGVNSIAIGYQATVTASNTVLIGNSTTETIGGHVNWTAVSDRRFKKNVREDVVGIDFIKLLRPVTYNYDAEGLAELYGTELNEEMKKLAHQKSQTRFTGFLAQEVEQAAQTANYNFSGVDAPKSDKEAYGLRYAEFVVPLVKTVQEQQAILKNQGNTIQQQEAKLKAYQARLNQLNKRMDELNIQANKMARK